MNPIGQMGHRTLPPADSPAFHPQEGPRRLPALVRTPPSVGAHICSELVSGQAAAWGALLPLKFSSAPDQSLVLTAPAPRPSFRVSDAKVLTLLPDLDLPQEGVGASFLPSTWVPPSPLPPTPPLSPRAQREAGATEATFGEVLESTCLLNKEKKGACLNKNTHYPSHKERNSS